MTTVACIPAFNEEGVIGDLIKNTLSYVDSVVVCDDGSSDNTSVEAKEFGALVIKHNENKGKGAALRTLFEHVRRSNAEIVVTIDGDGQFLPNEIKKLIKPIQDNLADAIPYMYVSFSNIIFASIWIAAILAIFAVLNKKKQELKEYDVSNDV